MVSQLQPEIKSKLFHFLESKYNQYNRWDFVENDPICIPHLYSQQQDIEIMAFFASILAWGQRKTIISKCKELGKLMDNSPHDFVLNHKEIDLQHLAKFVHRTFNGDDLIYFIKFLNFHFQRHPTLETAFFANPDTSVYEALVHFRNYFFSLPEAPKRTSKHIASPISGSACKRLNMFFRWMVRKDEVGVDFGLWKTISPANLICPCDVHVDRVARKLGLISLKNTNWQAAYELTQNLKLFDPADPVKYDFALFGLGIEENY